MDFDGPSGRRNWSRANEFPNLGNAGSLPPAEREVPAKAPAPVEPAVWTQVTFLPESEPRQDFDDPPVLPFPKLPAWKIASTLIAMTFAALVWGYYILR